MTYKTKLSGKHGIKAICVAYIIQNPQAQVQEVIQATGASKQTVINARKEVAASIVGTNLIPRKGLAAEKADRDLQAREQHLSTREAIIRGEEPADVPPEEMRRILAALIRDYTLNPDVRIRAIAAKQKLDYETQDAHDLGPGAPTTREQAVSRVAMILQAVGHSIVHDAIEMAFGAKNAMDAGEARETSTEAAETPRDQASDAGVEGGLDSGCELGVAPTA